MIRCKCIKDFATPREINFANSRFYGYEFVPSLGNRPAIYRVYFDDGRFHNFSFTEFREFFKNFQ